MKAAIMGALIGLFPLVGFTKQDYFCPSCIEEECTCIDCICYVPQYYDLECACNMFITADFLYWYAQEEKLPYGARGTFVSAGGDFPENTAINLMGLEYFKASWAPGFRLGLGVNFPSDGWDLFAYWTSYENSKKVHRSIAPFGYNDVNFPLGGSKTLLSSILLSGIYSTDLKAKWKLYLNTFDMEIGRRYWLSSSFRMRPYVGIKGAGTVTKFKEMAKYEGTNPFNRNPFSDGNNSTWKNSFSGIGITGGIQPSWYFTKYFSLFSSFGGALLWGEYKNKSTSFIFQQNLEGAINQEMESSLQKDSVHSMQPILDFAIGLSYEAPLCAKRYQLSFDAGWEQHLWFNHVQRTATVITIEAIQALDNNINFGGLMIRGRFDF